MKIRRIAMLLACAGLFAGCNPDSPVVADSIKADNSSYTADSKGGVFQVGIEANCNWVASVDQNWLQVSPASGKSNTKTLTVSVDANEGETSRSALLTVASAVSNTSAVITIVQNSAVGGFDGHIRTAEDFSSFMEGITEYTEGDEIVLENDLNLGGAQITPGVSFAGDFNGGGHSIYNFVVKSSLSGAALILENKGTIRDLKVGTADGKSWDGSTVITFADDVTASSAGIVAVNSGLLSNVVNYAKVDFNATSPSDDYATVGGVCGRTSSASAELRKCGNYGSVVFSGTMAYKSVLGGVLGLVVDEGPVVDGCYNNADINQTVATAKEFTIGGVVARADKTVTITSCVNEGKISYSSSDTPGSYLHIAGVVGAVYYSSIIQDCVNKGEVYSCINQVNRMGGIAGTVNTGGSVLNCQNYGKITIEQPENANWQAAAGIVGFEEKATQKAPLLIKDCVNNADVKLSVSNSTTHANQVAAGGIVGFCCSYLNVTANTNNAKVEITNAGSAKSYAGGIIGWYSKSSSLESSGNINAGGVSVSSADGAAGGVIGNASVASISISEETNRGAVKGVSGSTGSIAGLSAASLTSCCVGGSVDGTDVTAQNYSSLIQGSASTGTPVGCYFDGEAPASYITVTPTSLTFVSGGETLPVSVNSNCAWTVSCSESWLSASVSEGNADVLQFSVTAAENGNTESRSGSVSLTCKDDPNLVANIAVSQAEYVTGLPGNKITSASDFKKFLALASDATASDVYTLESDITLADSDFVPAPSFAGTLDGQNHSVTLNVQRDLSNVALIQTLTGTVRNLVVNGSIKCACTSASTTYSYLAAIVGVLDGGVIANCTNNADIENASAIASKYACTGGVVACIKTNGAKVTDCVNAGKISATGSSEFIVGGVVGYGESSSAAPSLFVISCSSSGDILMNCTGSNWAYVGGVVGKMGANSNPFTSYTISDCTASGNLNIVAAPKLRAGGVFGNSGQSSDYNVSGCKFTGKVSITSTQALDRIVAGVGPGFSEAKAIGTVSDCIFDGAIEAVNGGNLYLGGIYGNNGSASVVVKDCKTTARSSIIGFTTAKSVGMIAGRPNATGFTVKNCKVAGKLIDVKAETPEEITITADNLAEWMFIGSGTSATVSVTTEGNSFNEE